MKPISLIASQCQVIIRVRDENERMRGGEWQFVMFTWGLCPVSRQIWISSQTSHICYNLLQYVTQRHTRSRDTHYISFHFVCPHSITIVYLLIWAITYKYAFIFMPQYLLALISVHSWTPGYFSFLLLVLRKIWFQLNLRLSVIYAACPLFGLRITI